MPQSYKLYVVVAVRRGDEVLLSCIGKDAWALASAPLSDGKLPQEVAEQITNNLGIRAMRGQMLGVFFKGDSATFLYTFTVSASSVCDGAHEFRKFPHALTSPLAPGHGAYVALAAKAGPGLWVPTDCARLV